VPDKADEPTQNPVFWPISRFFAPKLAGRNCQNGTLRPIFRPYSMSLGNSLFAILIAPKTIHA
jgi:hypothetical protein